MASNVRHETTGTTDCDMVTWFIEAESYSRILKAVCSLELFDELVDGPKSASEIAGPKNWDADALEVLLSVSASMKLVEKQKKDDTWSFKLLNPGKQLLRNKKGPATLWGMAISGGMSGYNVDTIETTIKKEELKKEDESCHRENREEHHEHHHGEGSERGNGGAMSMWNSLPLDIFEGMDGGGRHHMDAIVNFFDLSSYKKALDIGAGSGVLGIALCRNYPDMHVTLLDGEAVMKKAKEHFVPKELGNRVSYLAGDILQVGLPKVDLFLTCQVLHLIPDDKIDFLMKKLRDHLNPGGAVMFIESLLNDSKDGPLVNMLRIGPDPAGFKKAPTPQSYTKLLEKNGFKDVQIVLTQDTSIYDVVFAKKA